MKKRIVTLLLTLLTVLSLLPTVAMAAESTGVGITPVTDPNLWTTRLNSQGQTYSYRPPTAAGRQLYCMDLGYSYRSGTESFTCPAPPPERMRTPCGMTLLPRPAWARWTPSPKRTSNG